MLRKIKFSKKLWCCIAAAQLLLIGISGFLYSRRETVCIRYSQDDLAYASGESGFYLDASCETRYVATPEFVLPKGMYTLNVQYEYEGDAKLNVIYIDEQYDSNVSGDIVLDALSAVSFDFRVKYDDRLMQIRGSQSGAAKEGDYILIRSVEIVPSAFALRNFLFRIALCLLLLDGILFLYSRKDRYALDAETECHIKILLLLIFAASIPLMVNYLVYGHDLRFHLMRIEGLSAGLMQGMFPVRIQPEWLDGHGYAVSIFYGDFFLYFPALLHTFGVTVHTAYKFYVLAVNMATILIAYHCFSKMSSRRIGLLCTVVYSLNIYRLVCIYTRAAVGEYTAMVFLPLVVYGLWKIYTLPEESKEHERSFLTLGMGCSGIFLSHMISTEITAFFIGITCVILWKKTFRKKNMLALVKSAVTAALLCLWFLVPFLDFMANGEYKVNVSDTFPSYLPERRGAFIAQFFMNDYETIGSSGMVDDGAAGKMPKTVGYASMAALAGWVFFCLCKKERDKKEKKEEYFIVFLTLLSLLLATYLVPYTKIAQRIPILKVAIRSVQFPWRFFSASGVLLAYLLCLLLKKDWIEKKKKTIFAAALLCLSLWQSLSYMSSFLNESLLEGNVSGFSIINGEYMPVKYDLKDYADKLTYEPGTVEVSEWRREKGAVLVSLSNDTEQTAQIEVPLLLYDGYHAVSDKGEVLQVQPGKSSRVSVSVPPGFCGSIKVEFKEPWYWRVSEIISLLALAGIVLYNFIGRRRLKGDGGYVIH